MSASQIETSSLFFNGDIRPTGAVPFTTFSDEETVTVFIGNAGYEDQAQLGRIQLGDVANVQSYSVEYRKVRLCHYCAIYVVYDEIWCSGYDVIRYAITARSNTIKYLYYAMRILESRNNDIKYK